MAYDIDVPLVRNLAYIMLVTYNISMSKLKVNNYNRLSNLTKDQILIVLV